MSVALAEWFVGVLSAYGLFGLLFGVCFVTAGVSRLDPLAKGAGLGFRLLILPGVAALWPLLLYRRFRGSVLE
ncbi:MAG: hypothetical protein L0387_04960 [Acidobacteria bacterium]|nr:hypothetical protein [Acidobacteriota bacterium]MCI0621012.1 hypothetical protein [Acidobacteriota bacterium]MCI0723286.1 hypothetical protein [Acidobacteriota bacterium]